MTDGKDERDAAKDGQKTNTSLRMIYPMLSNRTKKCPSYCNVGLYFNLAENRGADTIREEKKRR